MSIYLFAGDGIYDEETLIHRLGVLDTYRGGCLAEPPGIVKLTSIVVSGLCQ